MKYFGIHCILTLFLVPFWTGGASFARDEGEIPGMVLIPAGEFQAGSDENNDERPVHKVYLDAFFMDIHEVTQKDYKSVMGKRSSEFRGPDLPVERVTWFEAREYCKKVGKRLPTEAEWEKAARSGTSRPYYWGEDMDDAFAWHWDNSVKKPIPLDKHDRMLSDSTTWLVMSGNGWPTGTMRNIIRTCRKRIRKGPSTASTGS